MLFSIDEVAGSLAGPSLCLALLLIACWPLSCQHTDSLALTEDGVPHLQGLFLGCKPCC